VIYLKACTRCMGDVKFAYDVYGSYLECLQCGCWAGYGTGDVAAGKKRKIKLMSAGTDNKAA